MFAVIRTGGKQYQVAEGDWLDIEKLPGDVGSTITFDDVLLVSGDKGTNVGTPVVSGASVSGTVVRQARHPKVIVFKYRKRKNYRRKNGHRQPYTRVKIESIKVGGAALKKPSAPPPPPSDPGPPPPPPAG